MHAIKSACSRSLLFQRLDACQNVALQTEVWQTCLVHDPLEKYCVCFPGIEMEIVNSCEADNGGCSHLCRHTSSGPVCSCNFGYQLDEDQKTCIGEEWGKGQSCGDGTVVCCVSVPLEWRYFSMRHRGWRVHMALLCLRQL